MDPQYVGDVLEDIRRVGQATGAEEKAESVVSRMQARIDAVAERASLAADRPRVLTLEWVEPSDVQRPLGPGNGGDGGRGQLLWR